MANTYIEYTKGGSDFRTKGTISCWVKRSSIGVQQDIWSWGENNSSDAYLRFDTADNIEINCDGSGTSYNSTALYRDTNAWYHFVFSLDGSNATANLRRRFWINGVQQDEGNGSINAFSGSVFGWHSTQDLWIGGRARSQQSGATEYFDGLMSHFHYCSNYSYSASDFGETDATTGEWKIKTNPNVQYGSEGFFLKMENSSNMDLDSSGNNKTLTTSGTLTKTEDNPSNVFATWNVLGQTEDKGTLSNGNLTYDRAGASDNWVTIPSTLATNSGKWYYEYKIIDGGSSGGNGSLTGLLDYHTSNLQHTATALTNAGEYGWYGGGNTYINGTDAGIISNYTDGDTVMVAVDLDNAKIYWGKNGTWVNSGDPTSGSTGTGGHTIANVSSGAFAFAVSHREGGNGTANFGNGYFGTTAVSSAGTNASGIGIFEYDVPTGYTALSTKGLNL